MHYKRNQVEEAIAKLIARGAGGAWPVSSRLKRLLNTDRLLECNARSSNPEASTYAFFGQEPPGSGFEVEFGEYDTFALLLGLQLLDHGFPQQDVVKVLRRARSSLVTEHSRILRLDRTVLFDETQVKRSARAGQLAAKVNTPSFLVVQTGRRRPYQSVDVHVCKDEADMMRIIKSQLGAYTIYELAASAHLLHTALQSTQPRPRGRSA